MLHVLLFDEHANIAHVQSVLQLTLVLIISNAHRQILNRMRLKISATVAYLSCQPSE